VTTGSRPRDRFWTGARGPRQGAENRDLPRPKGGEERRDGSTNPLPSSPNRRSTISRGGLFRAAHRRGSSSPALTLGRRCVIKILVILETVAAKVGIQCTTSTVDGPAAQEAHRVPVLEDDGQPATGTSYSLGTKGSRARNILGESLGGEGLQQRAHLGGGEAVGLPDQGTEAPPGLLETSPMA
jgi:hypothetical protein